MHMIAKIFKSGNSLALRLPKELHPVEGEVEIESVGDRWVVTPVKPRAWPKGFFTRIRLEDPAPLKRPEQGKHRDVRL
jgi:virulence-associated protein VagC